MSGSLLWAMGIQPAKCCSIFLLLKPTLALAKSLQELSSAPAELSFQQAEGMWVLGVPWHRAVFALCKWPPPGAALGQGATAHCAPTHSNSEQPRFVLLKLGLISLNLSHESER